MRLGLRLVIAASVVPITVHLALAWLLIGLLPCSVAGAGLARLGAALAALAATFVVTRDELGCLVARFRRPNRALLKAMLTEGTMLGLQQVVAGFIVLLLYLTAIRAGDIISAALTLTHSGVYPLLFSVAWGSSQVIGAAAAQAISQGDNRELARVIRRCLGLSAVLAFLLPWGGFAICGRQALTWLIGGSPSGDAILISSLRLMGLLAVFFVFDFAINFLSALLRAAREQAYLLRTAVVIAGSFGVLLMVLPTCAEDICLIGAFIISQAIWAALLLLRVARRWPAWSHTARPSIAFPARSYSNVSPSLSGSGNVSSSKTELSVSCSPCRNPHHRDEIRQDECSNEGNYALSVFEPQGSYCQLARPILLSASTDLALNHSERETP
jgi:Na+-driven multidrug efflux pump